MLIGDFATPKAFLTFIVLLKNIVAIAFHYLYAAVKLKSGST
jgi:hypothetical protein